MDVNYFVVTLHPQTIRWSVSQAVRHRSAKPSRAVRLRYRPQNASDFPVRFFCFLTLLFPYFFVSLSYMREITIYTDGAASGNPGPGGYGVVLMSGPHRKELSGAYRLTTNNRMELLAVIMGLEALKHDGNKVTIYSDSKYVVDAVQKGWLASWVKIGFKNKKNPDLWRRYIAVSSKHHVSFVWVKGHASVPENERCDQLAVTAYKSGVFDIDSGYEELEKRIGQEGALFE